MAIYSKMKDDEDWKKAIGETRIKVGYSAYALAKSWGSTTGFPETVRQTFAGSIFADATRLLAIAEYETPIKGGSTPSQSDLMVLGRTTQRDIFAMVVEGKGNVRGSESFGPMLGTWKAKTKNYAERLEHILAKIDLPPTIPDDIRYQLLHRTYAAIDTAQAYNARYAVMLVHSFSQQDKYFSDYRTFVDLFGVRDIEVGQLVHLKKIGTVDLYTAWTHGDASYLQG